MTSNSKLTQEQKAHRKFLLETMDIAIMSDGASTIAYRVTNPEIVELSTSICGNDEQKFRRKVGEFYALSRFDDGFTVKIKMADFNHLRRNGYTESIIS